MKYELKKVFYLDGNIEEHRLGISSFPEILSGLIKKHSENLDEELAIAISRMEKPSDSYIPPKLCRDNCYVRFEIYPFN